MADPKLDEEMIIDALKTDVCAEACQQLQSAALYSVVATHDRGCPRPDFTEALDAAIGLHSQMGKIFMLASIREHCAQGTLNMELIDQAISKAHSYAGTSLGNLTAFMERLAQCPTSRDKVH